MRRHRRVRHQRDADERVDSPRPEPIVRHTDWLLFLKAVAVVAACTAVSWFFDQRVTPVNLVMIYLIGVVVVSLRYGQGPSVLASLLAVLVFDFVFVPPRWTFAVTDTEYVFTFAVMLATGLTVSTLTARVRSQAQGARAREQRTAALHSLSRDLTSATSIVEIVRVVARRHRPGIRRRDGVAFAGVRRLVASANGCGRDICARRSRPGRRPMGLYQSTKSGNDHQHVAGGERFVSALDGRRACDRGAGSSPADPQRFQNPELVRLVEDFAGQVAAALEREQLAQDAQLARVEFETERLRNSLLSAVSHDLRTPLAAIAGAGSTLLHRHSDLDPTTRRDLLQSIVDETENLNRLVGNLLDATRLESGTLSVQREWQSLEELVGVVLNRLNLRLGEHPVVISLPPDLPLFSADGVLLQQVLVNLIENAVKFSANGSAIELSARVAGHELVVGVADRGCGFPPGEELRIFDKFHRAPQTKTRSGAGLGLTICRGIVALHGGRIWAEKRPGAGPCSASRCPWTFRRQPPTKRPAAK